MLKLSNYLLITIIFLSQTIYAQAPGTIEASVDKRKVATGEIFTYTLKVDGEFISPKLTIPKFNDFTIVSQNQQRQYTSKGSNTALTVKITYHLLALNPGNFAIEGASVKDKEKELKAQTIVIEATGKAVKEKIKVAPQIEKGIDI
ncbi:MAG: BatD family protein [Candidatus Omnitrophica bacterium]|jgi:hypothetical protein|nr:BatD family protein [Candidatus Omnitrophota bacterium]